MTDQQMRDEGLVQCEDCDGAGEWCACCDNHPDNCDCEEDHMEDCETCGGSGVVEWDDEDDEAE